MGILEELLEGGVDLEDIQARIISPNNQDNSELDRGIGLLQDYMLYATAKDLSIFVTFQPEEPSCATTSPSSTAYQHSKCRVPRIIVNNKPFLFSLKMIDLDPKPVRRISKFVCKKDEWLNAWEALNGDDGSSEVLSQPPPQHDVD